MSADLEVVEADGPMQRRGAVDLRGVDVGLPLQQRTHSVPVALHGGVGHLAAGRAGVADASSIDYTEHSEVRLEPTCGASVGS